MALLLPVACEIGIDELRLSLVMLFAGKLSLIAPPVGVILFVACRIGDIPVWRMFKAVCPFLVAEALVVFLLALVPELSNALPELLFSRS